jgi:tetratricopeptide (TPR) repeat protein
MSKPVLISTFVIGSMLALAAPAQAAMLVLGGGEAQDCYKAAKAGASDAVSLGSCDRALADEPLSPHDRAATFVNRGVIHVGRREFDAAIADFNQSIKILPRNGEAFVDRGAAELGQKRYREALADLDKGLEMGAPEPEKAWYDKGVAHEALGDLKAAYLDYQKASELSPNWDLPKKELARFTVKQG